MESFEDIISSTSLFERAVRLGIIHSIATNVISHDCKQNSKQKTKKVASSIII